MTIFPFLAIVAHEEMGRGLLIAAVDSSVNTATAAAVSPSTQASIWIPVLTGVVSGAITLFGIYIKDNYLKKLEENRAEDKNQRQIFQNYAFPLATSCEKLIWRFGEIFVQKRHRFLLKKTLPLVFNDYKRHSTLYRIASLLGWIRAINLELNALTRGAQGTGGYFSELSNAIAAIQSALADGPHVELHRLEQMCRVWEIDISKIDPQQRKQIAGNFEVMLYDNAGEELKHDSSYLINISAEKQIEICVRLANYLCEKIGRNCLRQEVIAEKLNTAISNLSYKEALIYRDWQDAIGDAMLKRDSDSVRNFKIIGYQEFEAILSGQHLWMEVFRESIIDIDFNSLDPNDFRAKQLGDLARSVSNLFVVLSHPKNGIPIDQRSITAAEELINSIN